MANKKVFKFFILKIDGGSSSPTFNGFKLWHIAQYQYAMWHFWILVRINLNQYLGG